MAMKRLSPLLLLMALAMSPPARAEETKLVSFGNEWRYNETNEDLGDTWREPRYNDSLWLIGRAPFGFGSDDVKTKLPLGSDPERKRIAYCFRKTFGLDKVPKDNELTLRVSYDGGFALYLNGKLLKSANLPESFTLDTPATQPHESGKIETFDRLPTNLLSAGSNLIAVEVHLGDPKAAKMGFDLDLGISPISDRMRIKPKVEAPPIREWLISDVWQNKDRPTQLTKDYLQGEADALPDPGLTLGGRVWTPMASDTGFLDFAKENARFKLKDYVAIYCHAYVQSPMDQGAMLCLGSDDGCAVWVNGVRVHFVDVFRAFVEDGDQIPIHLRAGWNRILVKLLQAGGPWSLEAKLARIDGKAIEGLTYSVKNPLPPAQWQRQKPAASMDIMPGKTMAYINNGRIGLRFGQAKDSVFDILLGGRKVGSFRAAMAQFERKGIGYKKTGIGWCEANQIKDIAINSKDPSLCIAEVTVENPDSAETQRRYEARYRFEVRLDAAWFKSRLIGLKNTDVTAYEVRGYWHKLQPPVSDAEPYCFAGMAMWVSEAGGIGALARNASDFTPALRRAEGVPYGDVTRVLHRSLSAGEAAAIEEPPIVIFVSEQQKPVAIYKDSLSIR